MSYTHKILCAHVLVYTEKCKRLPTYIRMQAHELLGGSVWSKPCTNKLAHMPELIRCRKSLQIACRLGFTTGLDWYLTYIDYMGAYLH